MLSAVVIADVARLRAMREEWIDLLERSATNELTQHPSWLLPWWEVFGARGDRAIRSLAFYDGAKLVGLVPLLSRPHTYLLGIPFRRLELLASGEAESDEICSDYVGLIAARGSEDAVVRAFVDALQSGTLGPWDELVMPAMNGESVLVGALERALSSRGLLVSLDRSVSCPYVSLPSSWEGYLSSLSKSKRARIRQAERALETWAREAPVLTRVRAPDELEHAKAMLIELHRERRASGGVFASSPFRAFHDRVMPEMLALGALDLGWMSARGEPLAAFYNFRWNGKVYHYQSGRKLNLPNGVRVGVSMHAMLIRDAIAAGLREYDFLAGASQYKLGMSTGTRPLVTLRAARPSVVELVRLAAGRAKNLVTRVRSRTAGFGSWSRDNAVPEDRPSKHDF